jgi:hypothetical protein
MQVTKEMIDKATAAIDVFPYNTLPDGWIHRSIAEVALSAALSSREVTEEPVAWLPKRRWERMTAAEPWLTNIIYSEDQSKFFECVPLYASPLPLPSEEKMREALERSMVAIDDWLHVYAEDECRPEDVAASRARLNEHGTLAYIAEVQAANRAALSEMEHGKVTE